MSKSYLHNPAVIDRLRRLRPLYDRLFRRQKALRPQDQPEAILRSLEGRAIFLLSFGRSGTTVFCDYLGSHPRIIKLGEVLNEDTFHSFFRRLGQRLRGGRPSRMKHDFYRFLQSQVRKRPNHLLLFDLKFECLHLTEGNFRDPGPNFSFFDAVIGSGCPVILLERRDDIARFLSLDLAVRRGVFHSYQNAGAAADPVRIDIARLAANVTAVREQIAFTRRKFADYPQFLALAYEDLFINDDQDDGQGRARFDPALAGKLAALLGLADQFDPAPRLERVTGTGTTDPIANRDEVEAFRALMETADGAA